MSTLKRWLTPNFVTVERDIGHGTVVSGKVHVRDANPGVLSDLCDHFREDVFVKAGKPDPKAEATR